MTENSLILSEIYRFVFLLNIESESLSDLCFDTSLHMSIDTHALFPPNQHSCRDDLEPSIALVERDLRLFFYFLL